MPYLPTNSESKKEKVKGVLNLLSVGRIVPIKNIKYQLEELQKVKDVQVEVKLIGPIEDLDYYKECGEVVSRLPNNVKVEFIKGVSHDQLAGYYENSDVYFSATLNENFGHGIVEALGYSCPIIISRFTPWKNLEDLGVGFDLDLKENAFTDKIEFFGKMNEEEFSTYRQNSRQFAESVINSSASLKANRSLFQKV